MGWSETFIATLKNNDARSGATQPPRDPALVRSRFMKALGTGRGGALDA
jgi:hypothetical protein